MQAEKTREEADEILQEYRERLKEAREQADDIVARARKAAEATTAQAANEGREKREELLAAARRDIEAETRRSLERIRKEVADLTVLTTEKVTRKSLTGDDQKRLIDEALAEVDFSSLSGNGSRQSPRRFASEAQLMEEIARVYAEALFGAAKEKGKLDVIREQLGQFADALAATRDLQLFFFSPYFSSAEKEEGLTKSIADAEPELDQLPRAADREAPDAGALPDPTAVRRALGEGEQAARRHGDQRGRARPGDRASGSARRSRSRPATRSSCRAESTPTSSAGWSCRWGTWSWTRASETGSRN